MASPAFSQEELVRLIHNRVDSLDSIEGFEVKQISGRDYYLIGGKIQKVIQESDSNKYIYYLESVGDKYQPYYIHRVDSIEDGIRSNQYYFSVGEMIKWIGQNGTELDSTYRFYCSMGRKMIAEAYDEVVLYQNSINRMNILYNAWVEEIDKEVQLIDLLYAKADKVVNVSNHQISRTSVLSETNNDRKVTQVSFSSMWGNAEQTNYYNKEEKIIMVKGKYSRTYYRNEREFRTIYNFQENTDFDDLQCPGFYHQYEEEIVDYEF